MTENIDTVLKIKILVDGEDVDAKQEVLNLLTPILNKMKNDTRIIKWMVIS